MTGPVIFGVVNVTPDSFSDGGRFFNPEAAIAHGLALHAAGADILDVGGESTRPGAERVSSDEERQRVLPVIRGLVASGIRVSCDTMRADTAAAAIAAGASIVNDVSGGLADPSLLRVVAEMGVDCAVGHWRGYSVTMDDAARYDDVVAEVLAELTLRIAAARQAGISDDRLIIDPGFGFAKDPDHNWALLAALTTFTRGGHRVLIGASRKRFLGTLLPSDAPVTDRDLPTAVVSVLAAQAGAWGVRVHDVVSTHRALDTWRAGGRAAGAAPTVPGASGAQRGDRITLAGLRARGHHGAYPAERTDGQTFVVDVTAWLDLGPAATTDALNRTVHYGELATEVVQAVERDPVDLLETVAERVVGVVLRHPVVRCVEVTIHKPEAPISVPFDDVAVTLVRERP